MDKAEVPMTIVEQVREKYPNPCSLAKLDKVGDNYCILGAFLRYARNSLYGHSLIADVGFPPIAIVIPVLMELNPKLSEQNAKEYCFKILCLNDKCSDFETAWGELDKALKDGQTGGADDHS
jgi:hypothetical protein